MTLPVEVQGQLTGLTVSGADTDRAPIFVGEGVNTGLEQLIGALGQPVLMARKGLGPKVATALQSAFGGEIRLVDDASLRLFADDVELSDGVELEPLIPQGREWLAEIFVLVLEVSSNLTGRNTARARQTLYDALRKVRVRKAGEILVEIGGVRGPLPSMLGGVLPIPHVEAPIIILEGDAGDLDWQDVAKISGAVATAIRRADLQHAFRATLLDLAQHSDQGSLEAPANEAIAVALGQPIERIREIQRSLRSTSKRLFDWLIPVIYTRFGPDAAGVLCDRAEDLIDDAEIIRLLARAGIDAGAAESLISICRDADSLDAVRRRLGIDLPTFNASLGALGGEWRPLRFERRLRDLFRARIEERRLELEQRVRDGFLSAFDSGQSLEHYVRLRTLDWITFEPEWIDRYDDLPVESADGQIEKACRDLLPPAGAPGEPLEAVRQTNRATLGGAVEEVRRVVRAWVAADSAGRVLPSVWAGTAEQITRDALASGALDFRTITTAQIPIALHSVGLWPSTMPNSLALTDLGLTPEDLQAEVRAENARIAAAQRARRSIRFGDTDVDGGSETWLTDVATALGVALDSRAFQRRSGPAVLRPFDSSTPPRRRARRSSPGKEPGYLSDEQRNLLGFAGELAAYRYLKRTVPGFADHHWVSSLGRRYLGLSPGDDSEGADFYLPRARVPLFFEVKAHSGDPGFVDLGRTEVARAAEFANDRRGRWRILYVANVQFPDLLTLYELDNPFSASARRFFKEARGQGVRLLVSRESD
jgi:hypothetical protein